MLLLVHAALAADLTLADALAALRVDNPDLAQARARVLDLPVHEGQDVKAGDPLVTLDCADPQAALAEAQARFAAAEAQAQAAHAQADATSRASTANRSAATASRAQADALATQRDAARRLAARMDAQKDDVAPSNLDQVHASADTLAHQAAAASASASRPDRGLAARARTPVPSGLSLIHI